MVCRLNMRLLFKDSKFLGEAIWQLNTLQPVFPFNIIESLSTSIACKSSVVPPVQNRFHHRSVLRELSNVTSIRLLCKAFVNTTKQSRIKELAPAHTEDLFWSAD